MNLVVKVIKQKTLIRYISRLSVFGIHWFLISIMSNSLWKFLLMATKMHKIPPKYFVKLSKKFKFTKNNRHFESGTNLQLFVNCSQIELNKHSNY